MYIKYFHNENTHTHTHIQLLQNIALMLLK